MTVNALKSIPIMPSLSSTEGVSFSLGTESAVTRKNRQKQKFLQFQLPEQDLALLPAETVNEIITVSSQEVLPIPHMPYPIRGIYAWRNEMLWIIDLANLLGYPPDELEEPLRGWEHNVQTLMVMVVQNEGQTLGLAIPKVIDLIEQDYHHLTLPSADLFPEETLPFLAGYFKNDQQELMMLLKSEAIMRSPSLKSLVAD